MNFEDATSGVPNSSIDIMLERCRCARRRLELCQRTLTLPLPLDSAQSTRGPRRLGRERPREFTAQPPSSPRYWACLQGHDHPDAPALEQAAAAVALSQGRSYASGRGPPLRQFERRRDLAR